MKPATLSALFLCFTIMLALNVNARDSICSFQSSAEQTLLVELYTSEGCSTCPPAEKWLSRLDASPRLWKDFVPLAFHVDYWDRLGWRDPWGDKKFSARQSDYAALWRSDSVYTPGFVLNGKEWRDWAEYNDGPKPSGAKPGVLSVSSFDTNHWQVTFAPTSTSGPNYEVHAALLGGGLNSDVKAGENRGRRLSHDFVVLSLVNASLRRDGALINGEFVLPLATNSTTDRQALAVWITQTGRLEALQATGGWLVRAASSR